LRLARTTLVVSTMTAVRVLHVLDHSLPLLSGYSVRSHYVQRAQLNAGIEPVAVTSPKQGPAANDEHIDGLTYLRVPALSRALGGYVPGIRELRLMQRLAVRLAREVRARRIDLLHAHSPLLNGFPALWIARRASVPVVYEVRALWEDAAVAYHRISVRSSRYRLTRRLETWLLRHVDAVGVISQGLAHEIRQRGVPAEKIFSVPNGVDTTRFQPAARDTELANRWSLGDDIVFGFIGSFYHYEGLDLLLRALAARAEHAGFRLLLIGGGETEAWLRSEAQRLGIASRVIFPGTVPHADLARWYSVCDVLVYPRYSSRLTELVTPLKPLEAMAMGKAIVASDVGGLRELIRNGETGVLFAAGKVDALVDALARVARDADLRDTLGRQARRLVCEQRQWAQLAGVYADVYRRLLNQNLG
jgi:PEP-CTERM/exosortase A-associated glycosyltransferase